MGVRTHGVFFSADFNFLVDFAQLLLYLPFQIAVEVAVEHERAYMPK